MSGKRYLNLIKLLENTMASLALALVFSFAGKAQAAITTATLAADTTAAMQPSCLHYKVTGICFWKDTFGINTTLQVSHYIPDVVVTVYNRAGEDPWVEASKTFDQAAYAAGNTQTHLAMPGFNMEGGQGSAGDHIKTDLHLKEVDVIGNPAVTTLFSNKEMFLPSQTSPFFPYFQSMLDTLAWRFPPLETLFYPQSLVPGLHDIGQWPLNTWGTVYPRSGFITQANDAKSAAVVALRAGHIVTREGQPHLYQMLSSSCGEQCTAAQVEENSDDTQWQMLSPIESNRCEIFGKSDTGGSQWGLPAAAQANGAYVFNLWRRYHGCIQGEGAFISAVTF